MAHGDPAASLWGGFQWGDDLGAGSLSTAAVDWLALATSSESLANADMLSGSLTITTASCDLIGIGTLTSSANVDTFVSRLATSALEAANIKPLILVEIGFPSGTIRVARKDLTAAGVGWDRRLQNWSEISRRLADVVGDVRLQIIDIFPGTGRISDGFTDANPPEGAPVTIWVLEEDDPKQERIELFVGRVEQVVSVGRTSLSLEVVRADMVLDRTLGRILDTTIAPGAPDESLGLMIPHVYGEVEESLGLVTQFNGVSALSGPITENTTSVVLKDGSRFSASGTADVDDEIIAWTSKTSNGNELVGVTRGQSGTQANAHPAGAKVVERGTFQVLMADHPVASLEDVRIEDPDGNLAVPDPLPVIDVVGSTLTWPETPRITFPSRSVEVILIGPDTVSGTAFNPQFIAPEHTSYTDLNYAEMNPGQFAELTRTGAIEDFGEITRVGVVVAFDPTTSVGNAVELNGNVIGSLSAAENIPAWALRRLQRQLKATYDVQDPQHTHAASQRVVRVRPTLDINPQLDRTANFLTGWWFDHPNAFDGNANTFAYYIAIRPNHFMLFSGAVPPALGAGESYGLVQLGIVAGGTTALPPPANGPGLPVQVSMHVGPNQVMLVRAPNTLTRVTIPTPTTYLSGFVANPFPMDVAGFGAVIWNAALRGDFTFPGNTNIMTNDFFCIRDIFLDIQINAGAVPAATNISQRRTQLNFFDITPQVNGDWSRFNSDAIRVTGAAAAASRVNGVWWAVEVRPRTTSAIEVPNVYAKVRGLQPDGSPTEIAKKVITQAAPLGMGLTSASVAQGTYGIAALSHAADGIRLDFALRNRITGLALLRKIAEQSDCRQVWNVGLHSLIRKPDLSALPDAFRTYLTGDVLQGSMARSRQNIADVANEYEVGYRFLSRARGASRNLTQSDAPSQARFGVRSQDLDLDLVADTGTATIVSARRLERAASPRWIVTLDFPLFALDLRRGDLIALTHKEFAFAKAEVLSLPVAVGADFIRIRLTAIVWSL